MLIENRGVRLITLDEAFKWWQDTKRLWGNGQSFQEFVEELTEGINEDGERIRKAIIY